MLALLFASTPAAGRAEAGRPSLGVRLALEGRCAAALPELEKEWAADPARAEVAWRLGQCALRQKEYARAATALEAALALDEGNAEARLDLARARYHAGEFAAADTALARAPQPERALWQLYRGLVDLALDDAPAAVAALERAVALDAEAWRSGDEPEPVEPMASYYLGIAQRRSGDAERGARTLQGVAEAWAGTGWGEQARESVREEAGRRAFLTLGAGVEYDDNVILLGSGATLPEDISDESGERAVWLARGGVDIGRWGRTSAGALASYSGRSHFAADLQDFDIHFPSATLWLDHALAPRTRARASYDFGHAWVDGDAYLIANAGQAALLHAWSDRQTTGLYARVFADDYQSRPANDPATPEKEDRQRNRDGWGGGVGAAHAVTVPLRIAPLPDPAVRAGYFFTRFDAEGLEYSNQSHRVFAGIAFALPWGATLDAEGRYERRLYDHPSTFLQSDGSLAGGRRREHILSASTRLTVPIAGPVSASAYYRYRDSRSTSDIFDYEQHVVGGTLNVTFARSR